MANRLYDQQQKKIWQQCQAGHKRHERIKVDTLLGKLWVFDWSKYEGFAGYCTGQDDISRTLINQGIWEPEETKLVRELLLHGQVGSKVIDIGAHIGWYSILAAHMNYLVMAVEASAENVELLKENARLHDVEDLISVHHDWVGPDSPTAQISGEVELVIIDIEGNEEHAVEALKELFEDQLIKHALIEISPTFNGRYPSLVGRLENWGYKAKKDGKPFDGNWNFAQANFLFTRAGL